MTTTVQTQTVTPQAPLQLAIQGTDPAANAAAGQVYAKSGGAFYQDASGVITNLLAGQQLASNALGNNTVAWPFGLYNASCPQYMNSGATQNYLKGPVAPASGSIVGAFMVGNASTAYSGNLVVYKNAATFFTALSSVVMGTGAGYGTPKYATFVNGLYPFAAGDALDCYYTASGNSIYAGAGLILNFGNVNASAVSTALAANYTAVASDNQRVFVASSATQYTLTLPPTSANQDQYIRAVITGSGGIKVQAPGGVTIYNGATSSSAGGSATATQVGLYGVFYSPAGASVWTLMSPSTAWTMA